jgi:regulatory protein YycH of two-component signal transduction system YycFG
MDTHENNPGYDYHRKYFRLDDQPKAKTEVNRSKLAQDHKRALDAHEEREFKRMQEEDLW